MKPLLLGLILLFMASSVHADQLYRGEQTLWQDTVWEGNILIDGILTVAPEVRLEIRPGTVVRFTRFDSNHDGIGEHELFIQGELFAVGTVEKPILISSAESEPMTGDWGAINMMASNGDNRIEHCRVEYGYRGFHAHFATALIRNSEFFANQRGAQFQESTIIISRSRFVGNYNGLQFRDSTVTIDQSVFRDGRWGIRSVYSNLEMSDTIIQDNLVNGANFRDSEVVLRGNTISANRRGLYLQRTVGALVGNRIVGNSEHGIFLEEGKVGVDANLVKGNGRSGLRVVDSELSLTGNDIVGNDLYAVINDGRSSLNLGRNWWGTTDREQLSALIRDGMDRPGLGTVSWAEPLPGPGLN